MLTEPSPGGNPQEAGLIWKVQQSETGTDGGERKDIQCKGEGVFSHSHPKAPAPGYRGTKTFLARRNVGRQTRTKIEVGGKTSPNPTLSKMWEFQRPKSQSSKREHGKDENRSENRGELRVLSPWVDDNPLTVWHFHSRSKSAKTSNFPHKTKPRVQSALTVLGGPVSHDSDVTPRGGTLRTRSTLYHSFKQQQNTDRNGVPEVRALSIKSSPQKPSRESERQGSDVETQSEDGLASGHTKSTDMAAVQPRSSSAFSYTPRMRGKSKIKSGVGLSTVGRGKASKFARLQRHCSWSESFPHESFTYPSISRVSSREVPFIDDVTDDVKDWDAFLPNLA